MGEVRLGEEDVAEAHVSPRCHVEVHQEVVAVGAGLPGRQEELERLVGSWDKSPGDKIVISPPE